MKFTLSLKMSAREKRRIREILEGYGLETAGGITSTVLVDDIQKPSLFDTFCYTDPRHRAEYLRVVREAAEDPPASCSWCWRRLT